MRRAFVLLGALAGVSAPVDAQAPMDRGRLGIPLTEVIKPWTGDLDGMAERRIVRVLTTYSKTYVSDIYKYYVTHLLIQGQYIKRRDLKKIAPVTSSR